jgi:GxxExxY protein
MSGQTLETSSFSMIENDPLTEKIIGAAIEVHRILGPRLLESSYEDCLAVEFMLAGLDFERQLLLPFVYKSITVQRGFRCDFIVEQKVIIEIKTVDKLLKVHEAQVLTYLKLSGIGVGLLINFNSVPLKDGIRRLTIPSILKSQYRESKKGYL